MAEDEIMDTLPEEEIINEEVTEEVPDQEELVLEDPETGEVLDPATGDQDSVQTDPIIIYSVEPEAPATIWEKPFEEYTPTEGYLFLLFVLALTCVFYRIFKKGVL